METFSGAGLEGEAAWKAAAQLRVLLRFADADNPLRVVREDRFWSDPDVRWLAGVNHSGGVDYIQKERFTELLCWLELPALLRIASGGSPALADVVEVASAAKELTSLLEDANFEFGRFLQLASAPAPDPTLVSGATKEPTAKQESA